MYSLLAAHWTLKIQVKCSFCVATNVLYLCFSVSFFLMCTFASLSLLEQRCPLVELLWPCRRPSGKGNEYWIVFAVQQKNVTCVHAQCSAQHCPVECMISSWHSLTFVQSIYSHTWRLCGCQTECHLTSGVVARCATGLCCLTSWMLTVLSGQQLQRYDMLCCVKCYLACSLEISALQLQTALLIVYSHITVTELLLCL